MRYEVIVVGGGMSGLSCALGLAQEGFKVAVVEAKKITRNFDVGNPTQRVSMINGASQALLKQLGVWQSIFNLRSNNCLGMEVWDQNSSARLGLKAADCSLINLGVIVENDLIVSALYQKLDELDVCIFEQTNVIEILQLSHYSVIKLKDGTKLESQLIIGADGANSFIRNSLNFSCKLMAYEHYSIVANVKATELHQNTAYQRFLNNGVLALLPLSDPYVCSIVYSVASEFLSGIKEMSDVVFGDYLSFISEGVLGKLEVKSSRIIFELMECHASQYYKEGVVLIADAAHTIHPLAGQGINLGFSDVIALIDVLVEAKRLRRNIADISTLAKYENKRRFNNQLMINMMRFLKQLFCNDNVCLIPLRALGMNFINKNTLLKWFFMENAAGL